jgi:protein gp37
LREDFPYTKDTQHEADLSPAPSPKFILKLLSGKTMSSNKTKIQWADVSDNPVVPKQGGWWCEEYTEGCDNCYSGAMNQNGFYGGNKLPFKGDPPELIRREGLIEGWTRMEKSKRHFVGSMTDLFGKWVPIDWQFEILDAMQNAPLQTFMLLTKRPHLMHKAIALWLKSRNLDALPSNIEVGASIEMQKYLLPRTRELLKIPASVRFISFEPLLEAIQLSPASVLAPCPTCQGSMTIPAPGGGQACPACFDSPVGQGYVLGIHQAIIGGESGALSKIRPFDLEWGRSLIQQCREFGIAPFFKQTGNKPLDGGLSVSFTGKGGDEREFPPELRVREFPASTSGVSQ